MPIRQAAAVIGSIALGLLAALLFAAAGALQHSVTRRAAVAGPARTGWVPVVGLVGRLLRSPVWLGGLACNVLGFAAHATALHLGSITIVQALLAVQLMFALPLAAARTGSAPLARDWLGTLAVCAGIAALVGVRGDVPQTTERGAAAAWLAVAALALMTALIAAARLRHRHPPTRTALIGVAAGTGFSVTAAFTVIVTDDLARRGPMATLLHWPVLCLALSGLVAAVLVQEAFASGSFPVALAPVVLRGTGSNRLAWLAAGSSAGGQDGRLVRGKSDARGAPAGGAVAHGIHSSEDAARGGHFRRGAAARPG